MHMPSNERQLEVRAILRHKLPQTMNSIFVRVSVQLCVFFYLDINTLSACVAVLGNMKSIDTGSYLQM